MATAPSLNGRRSTGSRPNKQADSTRLNETLLSHTATVTYVAWIMAINLDCFEYLHLLGEPVKEVTLTFESQDAIVCPTILKIRNAVFWIYGRRVVLIVNSDYFLEQH
jgi:hypothetical protein